MIPPTEIEKIFPLATVIGWPVNIPNHHLRGVPAESHSSAPTMFQVEPEPLVQDNPTVGPVVCPAAAELKLQAVPPVVYPVPDNSVPAAVTVGTVVTNLSIP